MSDNSQLMVFARAGRLLIFALCLLLLGCANSELPSERATAQQTPNALQPSEKPGWRLIFNDEFEDAQLNARKWTTQYWYGRTNPPELQYYAPDAFEQVNGILRIKAQRRAQGGMAFTSGIITTYGKFSFTYGYLEARARVPRGAGLWPAFWAISFGGQPLYEIDVMEVLGHDTRRLYTGMHWRDGEDYPEAINNTLGPDLSEDFHLFAAEWRPDMIIWYRDGVEVFRVYEHVPNEPMYVLANLAVGGKWPGNPDSTTPFPAYYDIDYIRVYQREP